MAINSLSTGFRPGVCTSGTRPTAPYEGQVIYETDTDLSYVWGGAAWQQVSGGTAVGNSGLVFVKSQTIGSGVTAVTVSNAFSSAYDNYKITITGGTASGSYIPIRFQLGASVTQYYSSLVYGNYATSGVAAAGNSNSSYWLYISSTNISGQAVIAEVNSPFLAQITTIGAAYYDNNNAGFTSGFHNVTTSYTDFTVTPNSGTWSNSVITVYGYRKGQKMTRPNIQIDDEVREMTEEEYADLLASGWAEEAPEESA